jgi:hypothetical protein
VVKVEVERMPPGSWARVGQATQDRWRQRLQHDAGHAVPEPHAAPLGSVVEERGAQEVQVVMTATEELPGHVEPVAAIGDRHRLEERNATDGKDAADERLLLGIDTRADVRHELPDPMHR